MKSDHRQTTMYTKPRTGTAKCCTDMGGTDPPCNIAAYIPPAIYANQHTAAKSTIGQ